MTYTRQTNALLFAAVLVFAPRALFAQNVIVENRVETRASSGGNVSNGTIVSGENKNSVTVQTYVNGNAVENFHAEKSGPISYDRTITVKSATVAPATPSAPTVPHPSPSPAANEPHASSKSTTVSLRTLAPVVAPVHVASTGFISKLVTAFFAFIYAWIPHR